MRTLLLMLPLMVVGWNPLGTGSSRHEEKEVAEEIKEIVEDTEHIQEDLEEIYTKKEIDSMDPDEIAFTWFTSHDNDENAFLDGLEMYKAIQHAHPNEDRNHNDEEPIGRDTEDETTLELIDKLLRLYDANEDGYLDFTEFMKSFDSNNSGILGR